MKLIDLLVSHLGSNGGWPIGAEVCAQDNDCEVVFYSRPGIHRRGNNLVWTIPEGIQSVVVKRRIYIKLADDMDTAVVSREQYESALSASQQSAWNGDGLPPVGCECEARYLYATNAEWFAFRCVAVDCEVAFGWGGKEPTNLTLEDFEFRPIRTEAERKRKDTAQEMCNLFGNGIRIDEKAGYGTTWLEVYDAIAAGKIPHVTLK